MKTEAANDIRVFHVFGPQGCGKTIATKQIASYFGVAPDQVEDLEQHNRMRVPTRTTVFLSQRPFLDRFKTLLSEHEISFEEIAYDTLAKRDKAIPASPS